MLRRLWIALALGLATAGAHADELVLANGDTLTGEIVEWAVDHVVIEHPQLGRVRLALDELKLDTGEPPSPGLLGTGFLRGWNREVSLGWNGRDGNTVSLNITAAFDFNYTDDWRRWRFNGRWFFDSDDNVATDNNARINLRRDWLFPGSRWFAYSIGRYQFDKFESWKHRAVLAAGPGYHLLEKEAHQLDGRLGLNVTREWGERNETKGAIDLGFDYTWQIAERHTVTLSNDLFTEYSPNPGEFRNLTIGEWKVLLTERPKLNLTIGAENEYETDIDPGDKKNDIKYWVAIGLGF